MSDKWNAFLSERCHQAVVDLAASYPDHHSITLSMRDIDRFDPELGDAILDSPDDALRDGIGSLMGLIQDAPEFDYEGRLAREDLYLEIKDFRVSEKIRTVRSRHIDKMVALDGLVRSASEVKPKIQIAVYECQRCGARVSIPQPGIKMSEPRRCSNQACDRGGPFKFLRKDSKKVDSQHIVLQEYPEDMKPGEQPHTVKLELIGELPGHVTPGERINAVGIYRTIEDLKKGPFCETYMDTISLTSREAGYDQIIISEKDEKEILELAKRAGIHELIAKSIAPDICGLDDIKEAMALQLVGSLPKILPGGSRRRGDIHILLVGDPGLAKSQLLRKAKAISPRGVFASGKSATSAGLTYAAVKDQESGRWTLEAGALPMANGGIACIDELDKMRDEDRSALHEAAEQQTISVAKAGMIATLNCACSILAAANPKLSRFDEYLPIAAQINLQPALLTRFDLIFIIADKVDEEKDSAVADSILHSSQGVPSAEDVLDPAFLRKYIAYCRRKPAVNLDHEAEEWLKSAYLKIRLGGSNNHESKPVPITPRYLEGMIRLAEASARLRLSPVAELEDAQRATKIMVGCLRRVGVDPETGEFDIGVLEMGASQGMQDRTRALLELLQKMAKDCKSGIPLEEILKAGVEELGIDKHHIEAIVDRLRTDGVIGVRGYNKYMVLGA